MKKSVHQREAESSRNRIKYAEAQMLKAQARWDQLAREHERTYGLPLVYDLQEEE